MPFHGAESESDTLEDVEDSLKEDSKRAKKKDDDTAEWLDSEWQYVQASKSGISP